MYKTLRLFVMALLLLSLLLTSCSGIRWPEGAPTVAVVEAKPLPPTQAPPAAPLVPQLPVYTQASIVNLATPEPVDPCSSIEAKRPEIENLARIMGEFDDTSYLIQSIPDRNQMVQVILVLQAIRREAINYKAPECLKPLKEAQVNFMSGVVLTSISIMSSASDDTIKNQLAQTRSLRASFDQELANQLGLKYITATPVPTIPPTAVPPTSTTSPVTATVDQDIYVVQGPGLTFPAVGTFLKGQITNVIGRTEKGDWIEIDIPSSPGNAGWVPKQLIKLNGAEASLPIVPIPTLAPTTAP
ncbi:hypothetical protein hrd7_33500 (plasmid) [Leptolinea sp. HRD-7]|nr:hypothetical protein hrd7_33500 [Leptolinea sp. HRD-7]